APAGQPMRAASPGSRRTGPWRSTLTSSPPAASARRALSEPSMRSHAARRRDGGIGWIAAIATPRRFMRSQCSADEDFLYLARALVNLAHAHVAVDALDRKVARVAVAAEDLDRRRAHALRHLAREQLGHRGLLQARQPRVLQARRVVDELARRLDLRGHV